MITYVFVSGLFFSTQATHPPVYRPTYQPPPSGAAGSGAAGSSSVSESSAGKNSVALPQEYRATSFLHQNRFQNAGENQAQAGEPPSSAAVVGRIVGAVNTSVPAARRNRTTH